MEDVLVLLYVFAMVTFSRFWLGAIFLEGRWTWRTSKQNITLIDPWYKLDSIDYSGSNRCMRMLKTNEYLVTSADCGTSDRHGYICEFKAAPAVVTVPKETYMEVLGTTVTLICNVTLPDYRTPLLSVYWKKIQGDNTIVVSTADSKFSGSRIASPSLTIYSLEYSDEAYYQCFAKNYVREHGKSNPIFLDVMTEPEKIQAIENYIQSFTSSETTEEVTNAVKQLEEDFTKVHTEYLSESSQDNLVNFLDDAVEKDLVDTSSGLSALRLASAVWDLSLDSIESVDLGDDKLTTAYPDDSLSTQDDSISTTPPTATTPKSALPTPPTLTNEEKTKLKEKTEKITTLVSKIADVILKGMGDQPSKKNLSTKAFALSLSVDKLNSAKSYDTKIVKNGKTLKTTFEVPKEVAKSLPPSEGLTLRVKMILHAKNPFIWDTTSIYITTPTVALSVLDQYGNPVIVKDLNDPVVVNIPNANSIDDFVIDVNTSKISIDEMFVERSVIQPRTLSYKITLQTIVDPPSANVMVKYALMSDRKVIVDDAYKGEVLDENKSFIFKTPKDSDVRWNFGFLPIFNLSDDLRPNITIIMGSVGISCRYWDKQHDNWQTDGCQVSTSSSDDNAKCVCNHLTEFGSGYFVLPTFVDPFKDAVLFLTFFENPVIISTTVILWLVYLMFLCWARKVDRREQSEVAVLTPFPSHPNQKYKYLMCVVTAWRLHAGTTARVSCYIEGRRGRSRKHCLSNSGGNRTLFKSGSEDWFLITSVNDLGEIKRVAVWHDSRGISPAWLLSRILVEDMQNKVVYHFLCNTWLDINKGITSITLPSTSNDEFKTLRKKQFMMMVADDLRTGHVIFSIISNNADNNLSRTQRLSCAWSIILWTMLTCLMFQGIPTDDDIATEISGVEFSLSIKDIIIGIQSSIIMFPVNYIIVQLFLRTKKKDEKSLRYMDLSTLDVNNAVSNNQARKMLPWWMIYFNWTFVILSSLICTYFIMLYGLKFGYASSLEWLVTFITAFFDEALILEPINVAAIAFLFIFILRRPYKYEQSPTTVLQIEDEEAMGKPGYQDRVTFIPPRIPKKVVRAAKKEYETRKRLETKVTDICLYLLFTFVLFFVIHINKSVDKCFQQTQVVIQLIGARQFEKVNTSEDILTYINTTLVPFLGRTGQYDMKEKTVENDFLLIGKYRVRQIRIEQNSCYFDEELTKMFTYKLNCTDSLSLLNDDTISYKRSWKAPVTSTESVDEWTYQSALDTMGVPYIGLLTIYGGGGYFVDFETSNTHKLSDLLNKEWLDARTKAVFIELTLYNANVNLFSSVMLVIEYSSTGSLLKSVEVFTTSLSSFNTNKDLTRVIFEVFLCCLTVFFIYLEFKKIQRRGIKRYIFQFWSIISIFQLSLCIALIALYVQKYVMIEWLLNKFRSNGQEMFYNFGLAVMFDNIASYIGAILVAVTTLKFIRLLMFNTQLKYLLSMIENTKMQLKAFTFLFIMCLLAFTTCAYLLFGRGMYGHRTYLNSLLTMIESTIRIADFQGYVTILPIVGPCFLCLFIVVFVFVLMKFFTVIVINAVTTVKKQGVKQSNDFTLILRYVIQLVRTALR